jgi:hypothetical protein
VIDLTLLQNARHDRIAALLQHGVSTALVGRLIHTERLQMRLAEFVSAQLGELDALDGIQASVLAMSADAMADLAMRAGAIWHARAIARIIDTPSRRALLALLGDDRYRIALESLNLDSLDLAALTTDIDRTPEAIAKSVETDGAACLAAWCEAQPPQIANRLALLKPAGSPTAIHKASGPVIIAWLLERQPW